MIELNKEITGEMNRYLEGTTIEEILLRNKKLFRFQMMLKPEHMAQSIDALEFSVRSNNSLRRAGIHTVGELVEECCAKPDTTSRKQLQRYRNLGRNSADEILIKLFYYQFSILPESRRKEYMRRIAEANR